MAKYKEEEDDKPDGLEIISIGSLYSGTWDKKYWSSSRGKDRYPYPLGYHARRAFNGSTYKMEIQEGSKGPLFVITSADGHLCSGQTPDITWEKFQKKGFLRMKIWHGKRSSCKIDGIEFFGFRNPFVQRLLRELVANVNGIAEHSLLSSSFCNGASSMDDNNQYQDALVCSEILPHLARPQVKGKRNKRCEIVNPKSLNVDGSKRLRAGDPTFNGKPPNSTERNHKQSSSSPPSGFSFHDKCEFCPLPGAVPVGVQSKYISGEANNHISAEDCLHLKPVDAPDHIRVKALLAHEDLASSENNKSTGVVMNSFAEERPLDRLQNAEVEGLNFPASSEFKDVDASCPGDSLSVHDVDLCAPDTLDFVQDDTTNSAPSTLDKITCGVKEELMTADVIVSEALVNKSHSEEEMAPYDANMNSEKSDFDSVSQDIAKSMMTLLLPHAIPLLKKTRRKKKKTVMPSENLSSTPKPREDQSKFESSEHNKPVVLQKFDDDQCPIFLAVGASVATVALRCSMHLSMKDTVVQAGDSEISNLSNSQVPRKVYTRKKVPNTELTARKHNPSLSESIICRKLVDGCVPQSTGTLLESGPFNMSSSVDEPRESFMGADTMVVGQLLDMHTDVTTLTSNTVLDSQATLISQTFLCASEGQDTSNLFVPPLSYVEKAQELFEERLIEVQNTSDVNGTRTQKQGTGVCHNKTPIVKEVQGNPELEIQRNVEVNNDLECIVKFLGSYSHPMPVLSMLLSRKGNEIYICALCGILRDKRRILFLYKLSIEEPRRGCPCFVGHVPVTWPSSTDIFGREIAFERSGLQLTPDGQHLVLLGSTRAPHCREGILDCSCSTCTLDCLENSAVKIVEVKAGYVSVVVKLRATDNLQCILVCEPDHLVAAGEGRRLHLWTMNSRWSAPTEEFTLSSNDCISPCIVEMKRIPKCASLVIGHNGLGEFTLWDISKRIFISRFSAPSTSVYQFCPISLFSWQREVNGFSCSNVEVHINRLMDATKIWFSEHSKNHSSPPLEGEDIAIWFLVSTVHESDAQHDYESNDCQRNPVGRWRLALLVKNTMILGKALDIRAAAVNISAGHGIIGTVDGLVYMWELLTGNKLGTLHEFKGGSVSCIATDDLESGVLAVVDERGQAMVYRRLQ
uniref:FYR C-terminal domain-containing protein n=1 Tax=Manihot esculenta TaxID=3983 RepID=A0A2C9WH72_MANES